MKKWTIVSGGDRGGAAPARRRRQRRRAASRKTEIVLGMHTDLSGAGRDLRRVVVERA